MKSLERTTSAENFLMNFCENLYVLFITILGEPSDWRGSQKPCIKPCLGQINLTIESQKSQLSACVLYPFQKNLEIQRLNSPQSRNHPTANYINSIHFPHRLST